MNTTNTATTMQPVLQYDDISHAEMVVRLAKDGAEILAEATKEKLHLWHMATGLMGEAVELLTATDQENVREELGDCAFYTEALFQFVCKPDPKNQEDFLNVPPTARSMFLWGKLGDEQALVVCAGDILDIVKKHVAYNKPLDTEKLTEAIGDAATCLVGAVAQYGLGISEVRLANQNKLWQRYPGFVYSNACAQARADKPTGE